MSYRYSKAKFRKISSLRSSFSFNFYNFFLRSKITYICLFSSYNKLRPLFFSYEKITCKYWKFVPQYPWWKEEWARATLACNAGCTLLLSAFGESLRRELPETRLGQCDSLHSGRELSILARDTRWQPGETWDPLTRAYRLLKKRDLNEMRHERRGYTRWSKVRRVFPPTFSLSPCFGFPRRECTVGITVFTTTCQICSVANGSAQNSLHNFRMRDFATTRLGGEVTWFQSRRVVESPLLKCPHLNDVI